MTIAALEMRVQNLEQLTDLKHGELIAISAESKEASIAAKDAAVRAANEVNAVRQEIRQLRLGITTRCEERHASLNERLRDMNSRSIEDEWDVKTDVMDRDQLVESRHVLKQQVANTRAELEDLKNRLEQLSEAERRRAKAEREAEVAKKAVAEAEKAQQLAESEKALAQKANEDKDKELRKERIKAIASITVTCMTVGGGIIVAIISLISK